MGRGPAGSTTQWRGNLPRPTEPAPEVLAWAVGTKVFWVDTRHKRPGIVVAHGPRRVHCLYWDARGGLVRYGRFDPTALRVREASAGEAVETALDSAQRDTWGMR